MATFKNLTGNFFELGAGKTAEINIISDGNTYYLRSISDSASDLYNKYAYGVRWDVTNPSPILKRVGNSEFHATLPIQSKMRGCVHKDGVIQYYLDADNWAYKEDGSASVLDGTDGEVGIEIPRFYIWGEANGNERTCYISEMKIVADAIESPHCIISAYQPTTDRTDANNIKLVSVVNNTENFRGGGLDTTYDGDDIYKSTLGKPRTNVTRANARTYARNNNCELMSYTQYRNLYWLYVIEYANFNSQDTFNAELTPEGYHQGGLGVGITNGNYDYWGTYNNWNPVVPCGYTNEFGNGTNIKAITVPISTSYTGNVPRWRGWENPFGHIWKNLDGVLIETPLEGASDTSIMPVCYVINNPDNYTDNLDTAKTVCDYSQIMPHSSAYIKERGSLNNSNTIIDIIPSNASGASSTTYMCDYYWMNYDDNPETLLVSGCLSDGSRAGLGAFGAAYAVGILYRYFGFMTIKVLE